MEKEKDHTQEQHAAFMKIAIDASEENVISGKGTPFGAAIVKEGQLIAKSANKVTADNDPTAHAEVAAIRIACQELNTYDLTGCVIYTSCEPCPMCLAAIYWSKISVVYYGNTRSDAAQAGFDDDFIYQEIDKPMQERQLLTIPLSREEAQIAFTLWDQSPLKRKQS
nr:nucleoside deaminase [Pedobacter sp. BAL39]